MPRLAAHGFRPGCDAGLHELGAPAEVVNMLGWWSRNAAPGKGTRAYYNSAHLGRMMMATERLGASWTQHPAPSVHVGRPAPAVDWDRAVAQGCRLPPSGPPGHPGGRQGSGRGPGG